MPVSWRKFAAAASMRAPRLVASARPMRSDVVGIAYANPKSTAQPTSQTKKQMNVHLLFCLCFMSQVEGFSQSRRAVARNVSHRQAGRIGKIDRGTAGGGGGRRAVASTAPSAIARNGLRERCRVSTVGPGRTRYCTFRNESGIRVGLEQGNRVAAKSVLYRARRRTWRTR
jgi:hypothetical protein